MSNPRSIDAWFQLMRLSNAPTVASNVFAGLAVGLVSRLATLPLPWGTALLLLVGALLVYTAGMVLNDAFDARVDATERPGRPIPSGRVALRSARIAGAVMLLLGIALLCAAGTPASEDGVLRSLLSRPTIPWALLLGAAVLAYDALHLRLPGATLLMALCRATVVVLAAFAVAPDADWSILRWSAGGLFLYVLALSIAAKEEMRGLGGFARACSMALPLLALVPLGIWLVEGVAPEGLWMWMGVGGALLVAATGAAIGVVAAGTGRNGVPAAVGAWIGAIPMVDAAVCMLLGRPLLGLLCIGMWGLAGALRPRIAAS